MQARPICDIPTCLQRNGDGIPAARCQSMSKPFSLALSVQLRDIAELVLEEDNLRWAELRSSRNQ